MLLMQYLADTDNVDIDYIVKIARRAKYSYKKYQIPKATGGKRDIYHPSRPLKTIQRWLVRRFLVAFQVHSSATAYKKGSSIAKNAEKHKSNRFLLRMDFANFFESLTEADLTKKIPPGTPFNGITIDNEDLTILNRLLLRNGRMTIGAPSSPILSNILMFEFDTLLDDECQKQNVTYTRYADDLFLSSNEHDVLGLFEKKVVDILRNIEMPAHMTVNKKKTQHTSKKGRRSITGLIVTPQGRISIGRPKKRMVKALVHKYITGKLETDEVQKLAGLLAYINDVEPSFIKSLERKYEPEIMRKLAPWIVVK